MKSIKLSTIIFCLLLISISPQSVRHPNYQTPSGFISGAVSPNIGFSQTDNSLITQLDTVALAEGKSLFDRHCGRCHSTGFVIRSGMPSNIADSLVTGMVNKAGFEFNPAQHSLIAEYLRYILPQE